MGKKNQGKKAGGDFWDEDEDMVDTTPQEFGAQTESTSSPAEPSTPVPEQLGADDEDDGNSGLMSALRKSKMRQSEKEAKQAEEEKAKANQDGAPQVKSKKEKEREKKEREKAKKKAQAERKKTAQKIVPEKKQQQQPTPDPDTAEEPEQQTQTNTKQDAKTKKKSAMVAALQKQQAAKKAAEEAQKEAEEAELRRLEEEQRKEEEEEQLREEARQKKKEKERQKKEELRAQGKLLTKKQKEQQLIQERRRQQLLDSGVQVEGLGSEGAKPKKPVYGKKKKSAAANVESKDSGSAQDTPEPESESEKTANDNNAAAAEAPKTADSPEEVKKDEPEKATEEEEGDGVLDDWEAALGSDGEVKDDWEALANDSDEDDQKQQQEDQKKQEQEQDEKKKQEDAQKKAQESKKKSKGKNNDEEEEENTVLERGVHLTAKRQAEIEEKREERKKGAMASASTQNLRSPICCILGHVDTGKTKLLDKVRQTNVQEGEAGGITQQIGATYFPIDSIEQKTKVMEKYVKPSYHVPGLLVIDTPGHESFTNLRSRGSSLCNIAILVVDIMHGLEPQTLESIRLLRDRKTPFVVALNKIDRLYSWQATPNNAFRDSFGKQNSAVQREFQDRLEKIKLAFSEQGLNSELYYQNKNLGKFVSLVPTSAVSGEGVPDLLYLLLELTQSRMSKQLMYLSNLEATILEVKVIEGFGTTIDVVLSNGILREGDRVVLCGQNGAIATNVRALLTPQPLKELRLKSAYVHHKEVKAALGVKIAANDLDKAVAGSRLLLVGPDDDEEELKDDVMDDLTGLLDSVDRTGNGVCVQASTLGALEALLDFLKEMKVPVKNIAIGPVYKRDVMQATTMLEKAKEYAVMLCFDIKIDKEAQQYADEQGIKIFNADIIYHLFDEFTAYQNKLLEQRRKDKAQDAVYPCILNTIQVINKRNPMIVGVDIEAGSLKIGTPITVVKNDPSTGQKQVLPLGKVVSIEVNHKSVESVKKANANAGVAIRLEGGNITQPTWGRHIDESDKLYSHITRKSIDTLKDPAFRSGVARDDWLLIKSLKPVFDIK